MTTVVLRSIFRRVPFPLVLRSYVEIRHLVTARVSARYGNIGFNCWCPNSGLRKHDEGSAAGKKSKSNVLKGHTVFEELPKKKSSSSGFQVLPVLPCIEGYECAKTPKNTFLLLFPKLKKIKFFWFCDFHIFFRHYMNFHWLLGKFLGE